MRSGSTLLKALIATRPDTTDLPETEFRQASLIISEKKIIVIKCPAWYKEHNYPNLPFQNSKKIILVRHPYQTIMSLKKMNLEINELSDTFNSKRFLLDYWYKVYKSLLNRIDTSKDDTLIVRYEDLLANPIELTSNIFRFIESSDTVGTKIYSMPQNYEWIWGSDDGGMKIRSLEVQKYDTYKPEDGLSRMIDQDLNVNFLLRQFGYI
jgi:hypothetical protein